MIDENEEVSLVRDIDFSLLQEPEAQTLIVMIGKYSRILESIIGSLEPSTLITYLFDLADAVRISSSVTTSHSLLQVSAAHHKLYVKGREKPLQEARLLLFHCARVRKSVIFLHAPFPIDLCSLDCVGQLPSIGWNGST